MLGLIIFTVLLCILMVITNYDKKHITNIEVDLYLLFKEKIQNMVESYYNKHIYENYTYELGVWYINENKQDITIQYSYIDYHGNAKSDYVIVTIDELNAK